MKKIALIMMVLFVLIFAVPANAERVAPTIGERIDLNFPPETFPADTPFHVRHGWQLDPETVESIGPYDFELKIVGVPVSPGLPYLDMDPTENTGTKLMIYNFPQGLPAGEYTFVGLWYLPCQYGVHPETCSAPNVQVLSAEKQATIIFATP